MNRIVLALSLLVAMAGCVRVKTEPIEVKPIYITVDVNVKVQRELDDVFGQLDANDPTLLPEPKGAKQ